MPGQQQQQQQHGQPCCWAGLQPGKQQLHPTSPASTAPGWRSYPWTSGALRGTAPGAWDEAARHLDPWRRRAGAAAAASPPSGCLCACTVGLTLHQCLPPSSSAQARSPPRLDARREVLPWGQVVEFPPIDYRRLAEELCECVQDSLEGSYGRSPAPRLAQQANCRGAQCFDALCWVPAGLLAAAQVHSLPNCTPTLASPACRLAPAAQPLCAGPGHAVCAA